MKIGITNALIPQNTAPANAKSVAIFDGDTKICSVPLGGNLAPKQMGNKLYTFGCISDIHVQYDTGKEDFQRALTYFNNENVDFITICGDLVNVAYADTLSVYKDYVETYSPNIPVYAIAGNHEAYSANGTPLNSVEVIKQQMRTYAKLPLYYTISSNPTSELESDGIISDGGNIYNSALGDNDVFIMVGIVSDWATFDDGELQWLYETLEANRNKRCFVFEHIRPDDASGDAYHLHAHDLWNGTHSVVFENLMKHYKNAIFFHGHSHFTLSLQTRTNIANIDEIYGKYSVHIPSLVEVRSRDENGERISLYEESEGYMIDVYENHIVLHGRDFIDGVFIPIANYCLETTPQTIEANTFTDSTGTIVT